MRRKFRNFASALSLLMIVPTAALWVRSYWISDAIVKTQYLPPDLSTASEDFTPKATERFSDISSGHGELLFARSNRQVGFGGSDDRWNWLHGPIRPWATLGDSLPNRCGFACKFEQSPFGSSVRLFVPWWAVFLATAILPAAWLLNPRRRRSARLRDGRCPSCCYDLTGNTSGVCPECGTTISHP